MKRFCFGSAVCATFISMHTIALYAATINPGDILVLQGGPSDPQVDDVAAVYRVDAITGNRELISGRGVGTGLPLLEGGGIALGPNREIYVTDPYFNLDTLEREGRIVRIDPETGNRTLISGPGRGAGPAFGGIFGGPGQLQVTDDGTVFLREDTRIFAVNPLTGDRTLVSSNDMGAGPNLLGPIGIHVDTALGIVVGDPILQHFVQVDPTTGNRTLLGSLPINIQRDFIVRDSIAIVLAGPSLANALFFADLNSGAVTPISGIVGAQLLGAGPTFDGNNVDLLRPGQLIVGGNNTSIDGGPRTLFQVDVATGNRTVISGSGVGAGDEITSLHDLVVVPVPEPDAFGLALLGFLVIASVIANRICHGASA
ncbi:MAG: hypothetical protein K1X74_20235 [Pirellulales bacterium]|nr:hypothetical protein [Pirellulales bacterium]